MDILFFASLLVASFAGLVVLALSFEPRLSAALARTSAPDVPASDTEEQALLCFLSLALVVLTALAAL